MAGDQHLLTQRLGEAAHRELGRVICALRRGAHQPEQRGDVGEVPVAGLDQVRQERLRPVHHAPEVDVHHPLDVGEGQFEHVTGERDAGVVDDQAHSAELRGHGVRVGQDAGAIGDVEAVGADGHAGSLRPPHRLGQPGLVHVAQREVRAAGSQLAGQRPPESRAGARDDAQPAGEAHVVTYAGRSKRRVRCRNVKVKPGHSVVLRPCASRYQLAQPDAQTVRAMRRCTRAL